MHLIPGDTLLGTVGCMSQWQPEDIVHRILRVLSCSRPLKVSHRLPPLQDSVLGLWKQGSQSLKLTGGRFL